jgi:hypothetical protein
VSVRIVRGMFFAAIDVTERRVRGGGVALVFASALLLRCVVTTFPHSGQATPPKYGDYEVREMTPPGSSLRLTCAYARAARSQAQRHWMVRLERGSFVVRRLS